MLTGDSRTVADSVAAGLGIDEVYSELLPGDKVAKVEELLARKGSKDVYKRQFHERTDQDMRDKGRMVQNHSNLTGGFRL